jgi:hypothetical protein
MSHLRFVRLPDSKSGLTKRWMVYPVSSNDELGSIGWYAPWRRYVFYTLEDRLFDVDCFRNIADFMEREMNIRRENASTV